MARRSADAAARAAAAVMRADDTTRPASLTHGVRPRDRCDLARHRRADARASSMAADLRCGRSSNAVLAWVALALGLIVGSFANVCIHRLPARPLGRDAALALPALRAPDPALGQRARPQLARAARPLPRRAARPSRVRYPLVEAANGAGYFGARRVVRAAAAHRRRSWRSSRRCSC